VSVNSLSFSTIIHLRADIAHFLGGAFAAGSPNPRRYPAGDEFTFDLSTCPLANRRPAAGYSARRDRSELDIAH